MKALCKSMEYLPGSFELTQGVKGGSAGKSIGGKFFRNRGFGWGEHIEKSKLILHVTALKECFEIWVDYFFKDNLGRLTEKRRVLIEQTMPKSVEVEEAEGQKGTKYYEVLEADLEAWLARVKALPEHAKSEARSRKAAEAKDKKRVETALKLGLDADTSWYGIRYSEQLRRDIQLADQRRERERILREEDEARERERQERRKNALHLWFVRRINPKHGYEQWQADFEGKRYVLVLRDGDTYFPKEGLVPVESFREFPGGIVLVRRI